MPTRASAAKRERFTAGLRVGPCECLQNSRSAAAVPFARRGPPSHRSVPGSESGMTGNDSKPRSRKHRLGPARGHAARSERPHQGGSYVFPRPRAGRSVESVGRFGARSGCPIAGDESTPQRGPSGGPKRRPHARRASSAKSCVKCAASRPASASAKRAARALCSAVGCGAQWPSSGATRNASMPSHALASTTLTAPERQAAR